MPKIIAQAHLAKLCDAFDTEPRHYALAYWTMLEAGLRVSEACQLAWTDVLHEHRARPALRLDRASTKTNRERTIPISKRLAAVYENAWKTHAQRHSIDLACHLFARTRSSGGLGPRSIQRGLSEV